MDRNSFSIVIPMVGSEQAFDDTLASVLCSQPADSQIIVAHDGSYSDPYDLRREVTFVETEEGCDGMASLLNEAIKVSTGSLTAVIRPGVELPDGWSDAVSDAFADPTVGSVATPISRHDANNRMVSGGVKVGAGLNRKLIGSRQRLDRRAAQRMTPLGPNLWAAFYRTSLLQTVAPLCDQMETIYLDTDIALTAQSMGMSCQWLPQVVVTTNQSKNIESEARRPHGRAAQRATRRHGFNAGIMNRILRSGIEILACPLFPKMLPHALGRLFAGQAQKDAAFHQEILAAIDGDGQIESILLAGQATLPAVEQVTRRAA